MTSSAIPEPDDADALETVLRWYVAMGVDAAIDETPRDRFAIPDAIAAAPATRTPPAAIPSEPRRVAARPPGDPPSASADALIRQAETIAASASTLDALRTAWEGFEGCALAMTASRMIFAAGNPEAALMILGAAPGSDDERQGAAFSGSAGRLVDNMLAAIGLSRETAYLATVIPWRPPGNRPPTPLEAALCLPFARRHIALAAPAVILCLGERTAQLLLDTRDTLAKLRGRWIAYEGETTTTKLAVTFSLDYLLSQPLQKKRAWVDLLAVAAMIETTPRPRSMIAMTEASDFG